MRVNHIQTATVSDAKNLAAVATSPKAQDFKESMRLASDPKLDQPVHGGTDAKGDKKVREEKKDPAETASVSTAILSAPIENVAVVSSARQTSVESASDDTGSLSPLAGSGGSTGIVGPVQSQVAIDPSAIKDDTSTGPSAADSSSTAQPVNTPPTAIPEKQESVRSADAPSKTTPPDSAKPQAGVAPVITLNQTATPAVIPATLSQTSIVDSPRDLDAATSADRVADDTKVSVENSPTKPETIDPASGQAAMQMPLPIQEIIAPQGAVNGEVFKGLEVASSAERSSAASTASPSIKGKPATSDLRGKREDAKVESKSTDTPVAAQPSSKMPVPAGVIEFSGPHAGTSQGSDLAVAAQAAGSGTPGGISTQSSADSKGMSGENMLATPNVALVSAGEAIATPALNSAHLVQSIHQSEMKLGMNSVEFGSISINTSVSHQALSAQISLDHPELSRVLSSHLSAVEEKLGQAYGLQVKVEVRDGGSSLHSGPRQQAKGDSQTSRGFSSRSATVLATNPIAMSATAGATSRLDIRI